MPQSSLHTGPTTVPSSSCPELCPPENRCSRRPSTSPASFYFFVKKKNNGLRSCIDYHSLNDVTFEYRYPLPLVLAALKQLLTARFFTKLDLRSAYNLIPIQARDEWKTDFSTTTGHYEYLVMLFGLCNTPSVFQAFVNNIFMSCCNASLLSTLTTS